MRSIICFLALVLASLSPLQAATRLDDWDGFFISLEGVPRELAQEFETAHVIENGVVMVPLIGEVPAKGLTPAELEMIIAKRLRDGKFFTRPVVTLHFGCLFSFVIVGGSVRNPGRCQWVKGMTLTMAVGAASGPDGRDDKWRIKRGDKVLEFSRKAIRKDPSLDPKVFPGDFIELSGEF
jgi:protein involved in polysaccharide export with SLBB domain